jgi:NDP-sugar pyrophosphorylase family protein
LRVREQVKDEEMFLANYADTLTDAPLDEMIDAFRGSDATACVMAVPPTSTHHVVEIDDAGHVTGVREVRELMQFENGGYFILRPAIFDALIEGEDLVPEAFRAAAEGRQTPRPSVFRLLAGGRHVQGPGRAGGHVPQGPVPVDGLGHAAQRDGPGRGRYGRQVAAVDLPAV